MVILIFLVKRITYILIESAVSSMMNTFNETNPLFPKKGRNPRDSSSLVS